MVEENIPQLKEAVESQHGGAAAYVQSVPVKETFAGQTVWEGVVEVLEGNARLTSHLCVVVAYRGKRQAVLRHPAFGWDTVASGCGEGGDCGGSAHGEGMSLIGLRIDTLKPPHSN
jgi:hypothetical protein